LRLKNIQKAYSPFCVQAKIIKLVGLKNGGRLSPIDRLPKNFYIFS
jgi:hypothetical protein